MSENHKAIERLKYALIDEKEEDNFPSPLRDSLLIISEFFKNNKNNKLCLVFPSKEYAAQWLSVPAVLLQIESDFAEFKNEIANSLLKYQKGDLLILNNEAVVEWVGRNVNGFVFRHKEFNGVDTITISIKNISKIQPAPATRRSLSSYKRVIEALGSAKDNPIDKILSIQTYGNRIFQKNSICLISKHIDFENSISEIVINDFRVNEYFKHGRIDDFGEIDIKSPLLIANNLCNLALYLAVSSTVSKIFIDGFSAIQERSGDFNDIDAKHIPTILITDLSEIDTFGAIGDYGFDFFSFTIENLQVSETSQLSPFCSFNEKLNKYISFNLIKELCINESLEKAVKQLYLIESDENNNELLNIKILLIQLTNTISRISHTISEKDTQYFISLFEKVKTQFSEHRFFLGDCVKPIEEILNLMDSVYTEFTERKSEKCSRLTELLLDSHYDYIICPTERESESLSDYINSNEDIDAKPTVIAVNNVNDIPVTREPVRGIITGWIKSTKINWLLTTFIFSELTALFYQFESRYLYSLQRRNFGFSERVKSTIDKKGLKSSQYDSGKNSGILTFKSETVTEDITDSYFDITDFELKINNAQYSKYIVKGDLNESVKAKRVDFKNDKFIYLTDTHGLLVLKNIAKSINKSLIINKCRIENLHHGDVIAFIKTEREVLNRIVSKMTTPKDLIETYRWIELWKSLLKNLYMQLDSNLDKLVVELRDKGCSRDPMTIRSWLFDDLRIGPRKDDDLISIALASKSTELYNNIKNVRNAIRQMTGWRMKASDFVIEQLKINIKKIQSSLELNTIMDFQDLGEVEILEIIDINGNYDFVDIKNINRLLEKTKL